jgi:hypothetical protein
MAHQFHASAQTRGTTLTPTLAKRVWEIIERGPNEENKEVQTFTKDKNVISLDGEKLIDSREER